MTSLEFDMVKACNKRLGEGPLVSCKLGWRSKEKPGLTSFSREIIPGDNFSVLREQGTKFDTDSSFNGGGNGGWEPPPEMEEPEEVWFKTAHPCWCCSRVNCSSTFTTDQISLANSFWHFSSLFVGEDVSCISVSGQGSSLIIARSSSWFLAIVAMRFLVCSSSSMA